LKEDFSMSNGDDDSELNEEFPLGDGSAETSCAVVCPCCGEGVTIAVDPGGGSVQEYVEDCEVCCNPWRVSLRFVEGFPNVQLAALDE